MSLGLKIYKRRWRLNKSIIIKFAWKYTSVFFSLVSFISLFVSWSDLFPKESTFLCKFIIGILVVAMAYIVLLLFATFYVLADNKVCVITSNSNKKVYVQYGDMYSPCIIDKDYKDKRYVVIPVNRCFDTIVDDHLVSSNTQHGRAFKKLYKDKKYNKSSLDSAIKASLEKDDYHYIDLNTTEKPQGNLKRYDVGTIVEVEVDEKLTYFLLGLSRFDEKLNAHTSKKDFVLAVQRLIENCDSKAQGFPVVLPLLGSGLSRTGVSQGDILHYLVDAFAINKEKITCDFHIVVWEEDKDKVSIKDLKI